MNNETEINKKKLFGNPRKKIYKWETIKNFYIPIPSIEDNWSYWHISCDSDRNYSTRNKQEQDPLHPQ